MQNLKTKKFNYKLYYYIAFTLPITLPIILTLIKVPLLIIVGSLNGTYSLFFHGISGLLFESLQLGGIQYCIYYFFAARRIKRSSAAKELKKFIYLSPLVYSTATTISLFVFFYSQSNFIDGSLLAISAFIFIYSIIISYCYIFIIQIFYLILSKIYLSKNN